MILDKEVKELRVLKAEHTNMVYDMQDKLRGYPEQAERLQLTLANLKTDREHLKTLPIDPETKLPKFEITIDKKVYTDRKEAAEALETAMLSTVTKPDTPYIIGEFQGFPLSVTLGSHGEGFFATMQGAAVHTTPLISSAIHNLQRLEKALYTIDKRIDDVQTKLNKLTIDRDEAARLVDQPFQQEAELAEKEEGLTTLTDELNAAAAAAKAANKGKERTCYFERAKLKREAARLRAKPPKPKEKKQDRDTLPKKDGENLD